MLILFFEKICDKLVVTDSCNSYLRYITEKIKMVYLVMNLQM